MSMSSKPTSNPKLPLFTNLDPWKLSTETPDPADNIYTDSYQGVYRGEKCVRQVIYVGMWFRYSTPDRELWNKILRTGQAPDVDAWGHTLEAVGADVARRVSNPPLPNEYWESKGPAITYDPGSKDMTATRLTGRSADYTIIDEAYSYDDGDNDGPKAA